MAGVTSENPSCPICFEYYNEDVNLPKVLNCGHTVCLQCLQKIVHERSILLCPLCNIETIIPRGGVVNITTNYALKSLITPHINSVNQPAKPNTTTKHLCSTHIGKGIEYYCKTCNKGICMKCHMTIHKYHNTLDLDLPDTRTEAVSQRTEYERFIQVKKQEFEQTYKYLDEALSKLKSCHDVECRRVEENANQLITQIMTWCERKKTEMKMMFKTSESKLTKNRDETKQQIEELNRELECGMLLTDSTNYTLLTSVEKLRTLEEKYHNITCTVPDDIYYITYEKNQLKLQGRLQGKSIQNTLYIPQTNHYRFNIKHIKDIGVNFYSDDLYNFRRVKWRCYVRTYKDGRIGVFVTVPEEDNPKLDYCVIDFQFTLINEVRDQSVIQKDTNVPYLTNGKGRGWSNFIHSIDVTNPQKGFVDSCGQFVIQFDITNFREIKWKN